MHPALSVISFTTLLGAAQGLLVTLCMLRLSDVAVPHLLMLLLVSIVLLVVSLGASFFHLGHPERAWRAMAMWRTSWLSREVIVLPAFIGLTMLWALLEWQGRDATIVMAIVMGVSLLLWICTAMIYACIKFIQEWAHPITLINYINLGIASGTVLLVSLLSLIDAESELAIDIAPWAFIMTTLALITRVISLQRNARLKPTSTLQSATGVRDSVLRQTSMGMSAGAFNTREFFHGKTEFVVRNIKHIMLGLCFVLPMMLLLTGAAQESRVLLSLVFPVQYLGLLAERWLFFAQARHPQNLYYQTVS